VDDDDNNNNNGGGNTVQKLPNTVRLCGHGVAQLDEALRYMPEDRGFSWNFSFA